MFAYGRRLFTADICLQQLFNYGNKTITVDLYSMVKSARLKRWIERLRCQSGSGKLPGGKRPVLGRVEQGRYLLVNHLETTDAEREISSFYTLRPSKQPLGGMDVYSST